MTTQIHVGAGSEDVAGQMQLAGLESHVVNCHFAMFMNMLTLKSPRIQFTPFFFLPDAVL